MIINNEIIGLIYRKQDGKLHTFTHKIKKIFRNKLFRHCKNASEVRWLYRDINRSLKDIYEEFIKMNEEENNNA
jgi:hypothetical protein